MVWGSRNWFWEGLGHKPSQDFGKTPGISGLDTSRNGDSRAAFSGKEFSLKLILKLPWYSLGLFPLVLLFSGSRAWLHPPSRSENSSMSSRNSPQCLEWGEATSWEGIFVFLGVSWKSQRVKKPELFPPHCFWEFFRIYSFNNLHVYFRPSALLSLVFGRPWCPTSGSVLGLPAEPGEGNVPHGMRVGLLGDLKGLKINFLCLSLRGAGPREQLSVTSFPCPERKFLPLRKGILLCAPETSFLFPPCSDSAGGKEEPSWPALFPLETSFCSTKSLHVTLGLHSSIWVIPNRQKGDGEGFPPLVFCSPDVFLNCRGSRCWMGCAHSCSWLGLLFLAPSAAKPRAGCLFHTVVTPGKYYGSARKKLSSAAWRKTKQAGREALNVIAVKYV